jgi:hypothetical protein
MEQNGFLFNNQKYFLVLKNPLDRTQNGQTTTGLKLSGVYWSFLIVYPVPSPTKEIID